MNGKTNQHLDAVLNDPARIAALRATGMLDSPPERAFDRLAGVARRVLGAPVCLVSLVEIDRQFFKSCVGLPEPWATRRETPLSHSFCQHVVGAGEPLVVEDAREHALLRDNLAIREMNVIAYLGIPRVTPCQTSGSAPAVPAAASGLTDIVTQYGYFAARIGSTGGERLEISVYRQPMISATLDELRKPWASALESTLHGEVTA